MKYGVVVHRLAKSDLSRAYRWTANLAPLSAARWLDRFEKALQTLDENPARFGLAFESAKTNLDLRQFLFGRRPWVTAWSISSTEKLCVY